jgi:HK97 family phage portal protein
MGLFDVFRRGNDTPPEVKASATGAAMVMTPGQPTWSKRDYGAFAKEGYVQNVVAAMSVQRIAKAISSVELEVWQGDTMLTQHPLIDLLERPNPLQSGSEYMEAVASYLMIAGNAYEEAVDVNGDVRELYALRPDRMTVIPSADGLPIGYEFSGSNGRKHRWTYDPMQDQPPIWHTKFFNPLDNWYGQSPMEAGAYSIDQHNEAMQWMQSLLQNSARPSGALVAGAKDGRQLSDDQFQRLKQEMQDQYQGAKNAGRAMLLDGGLTWQAMGLSPTDMGIEGAKNSAARDVALAFGVPAQLLGIPGDSTYANYQEARRAFWEDTVIPLLNRLIAEKNEWLAKPAGVEIRANMDSIPAIVEKRQLQWTMADASMDLTINERRELKGYDPIAGGDVLPTQTALIADPMMTDTNAKAMARLAGYETNSSE